MYLNTKYTDVFKYFCKYFFILFSKYMYRPQARIQELVKGGALLKIFY